MSDCTGDFSIEVNETKYSIEVESCINSTGINNITLSPTSGANIEINTCMIPATHPVITPAPDQDNSGNVFVQDVFLDGNGHVTGLLSTGVNFSGYTQSGDNVSIFVNDAGYMTSYTETGLNTFLTGISFNCSTKELLEHLNDGTHITGDLSCLVVSGDNISLLTNDSGYATTGQLASTSGHLQGQIDAIPADTNTFVSGVQYDTAQRDIILTRTDSVTLTGNLDVVVHSGDNVSKLANDAGYITGYTETDPIFSASPASGIVSGDITNWNDAYSWGDHSLSGYLVSGDNVSLLNNDVPYAISGSHITVNTASDSDNSDRTYIQNILVDEYGHVTGFTTAIETVVDTNTEYSNGVGLSLTGTVFSIDDTVIQSGDNVSVLNNDAGYITGYTETGLNTFVTGLTFDSGTNNLVLGRNDSVSITGQLDGVLVSGTSYHISVNGTGVDGSGRTYVQDIFVDSYGHITGVTTATETVTDTNTEYTDGTGLVLVGTEFNIDSSVVQTGDNISLLNNDAGYITGFTDTTYTAGTGLALDGTEFNIDSSVVQTGDNISVLNNDAGYITGFTETLTSLSGDSVNTKLIYTDENGVANDVDLSWAMDDTNLSRLVSGSIDSSGMATFTRDDASSFTVDFSVLFDDTNLSRITSGNFDTSSGILTLTRELDDTSVSVNLDGRYLTSLVGATGSFDYIDFTNLEEADYPSHLEGRLFYDSGNHALSYYNDESGVTLQIGQEEFLRVRNNTTGTITNGSVVRITGAHGNAAPSIDLASATNEDKSSVVGVATHNIETNTFGYITTFGIVRDVDTSDFSSGGEIYLSITSGALTGVAPVIPNYSAPIGYVIRSHGSNGSFLVDLGKHKLGGGDLKSEAPVVLSGVPFATTVANTHAGGLTTSTGFVYDSGNQNLYVGGSEVLVSGDNISQLVNDSNFTDGSGTANYVAKWSDSDTLTNSIIYDNGTGVGIGVSAPSGKLHVVNDESALADFLVGDPTSQKPYFGIKMASAFISAIFGPSQSSKLGGAFGTPDTCRIRYYGGPSDSGTYWTQESNFQDYELIPYLADVSQGSKFKVDVSGAVTFNNAFTFPTGDGTNGQTLVTDGTGSISWGAGGSSSSDAVRGTVSVTTTTGIFAVGGGYTTGALDVYLNGIKLADTIDYTATNGTSISLTSPATSGDILSYVGYDRATVAGTLQDTGDTVNGNFTVNGDLVVMGYKETHTDNGSTGAAQTITITGSTIQTFTLTNNCVFTLPSADAGRSFTVLLKTGAGSFTASFTGTDPVKFPSNATPSITTSGSRMDVFTFISDGTNWYGDSQQDYHV